MATIEQLLQTAAGEYYITPWLNAVPGGPSVVSHPTISGILSPGQRLTAIGGSYLPTGDGTTFERFEWTVFRASDGAFLGFSIGSTYDVPSSFPACAVTLVEKRLGVANLPIEGRATANVTVAVGAPQFSGIPSVTATGTGVGAVLTATDPILTGSPAPVRARVWKRDGAVISGQTGTTMTTDAVGVYTHVQTASNGTLPNAGPVASNSISIVAATGIPQFSGAPTMSRSATTGEYSAVHADVSSTLTTTRVNRWYYGDSETGPWTYRGSLTTDPKRWIPKETFAGKYITCATYATNSAAPDPDGVESPKATPIQIPALPTEGFKDAATLTGAAPQGSTLTAGMGTYYGTPDETEVYWVRVTPAGAVTDLVVKTETRKSGPDDLGNDVKLRVRIKYANGNEYFSPSATTYTPGIRVTAAATSIWPAISNIAAVGKNKGGNLLDKPYVRFQDPYAALKAEDGSNQYQHAIAIAGYESWRGNTATDDYVKGGLRYILIKGNEPNVQMGYGAMYCMSTCVAIYFARWTPRLWNSFTSNEQYLFDHIIKLCAIAAAAVARNPGDTNLNMLAQGKTNASTIEGGSNPNIRLPHYAHPQVLCAYLGGSAEGKAFFDGVTIKKVKALRDDIADALPRVAASFVEARPAKSPSWERIADKSANYLTGGLKITDHTAIFVREMEAMYSENVFIGLNDGDGILATKPNPDEYRGFFRNKSNVRKMQAFKDIEGKLGMCKELNSADGGGKRSSMSYFAFADAPSTLFGLVMLTSGLISPSASSVKALLPRLRVSLAFSKLADEQGYVSVAQATEAAGSAWGGNSHDWWAGQSFFEYCMVPVRRSVAEAIISVIDAA